LIVHHLQKLAAAGVSEIVINHAYLGHMIEAALGDGSRWGVRIVYSAESCALETGGGILKALPLLGEQAFLLINGDVWIDDDYHSLVTSSALSALNRGDTLAHLWLVSNPSHNPTGDFMLSDGRVWSGESPSGNQNGKDQSSDKQSSDKQSSDTPDKEQHRLTFSGISLIRPELVAGQKAGKFPLAPRLRAAMLQNQVSGCQLPDTCGWVDVGTPERLQQLQDRLIQRI